MDRVREWLETGRSRPVTVEFDLTNLCDHRCPRCIGFHPERDSSSLELGEARRILNEIRAFGARGLTFTGGGEPLLSPIALEALEHARDLGLDLGFITNGTSLTEASARAILRRCQWVRVSLDAASPEVFRSTHGMDAAAFRRALEGLRLLARIKREEGLSCTVGAGFLTCGESLGDIEAFARLGASAGADYLQFRPLLRRPGETERGFGAEAVLAALRRAAGGSPCRIVHSEHKYRVMASGDFRRPYRKCYGQDFAAVIAADAKMYACCHLRGIARYCIGDLRRESFSEAWDSARRRSVRDSVDFQDCPLLCRCDSFNSILWALRHEGLSAPPEPPPSVEHPNFL
jgi:MoaA/NifB/PqqE/SkfB family radical SAM enzyme